MRDDLGEENEIALLRQRLSGVPGDRTTRLKLVRFLKDQGRYGEARRELEAAAATSPEDPAPQLYLAIFLRQHGESKSALAAHRRALELIEGARQTEGCALLTGDSPDVSSSESTRASQRSNPHVMDFLEALARESMAEVLRNLGRRTAALHELDRVVALYRRDCGPAAHKGGGFLQEIEEQAAEIRQELVEEHRAAAGKIHDPPRP